MTRQGGWFRDFFYGVGLAWTFAWNSQRVYRVEAGQAQRWIERRAHYAEWWRAK